MNWQTKRRVVFGTVAVLTLGSLAWVGVVAWSISDTKASVAKVRNRSTDLRQELEGAEDIVDPASLELAAPGGETAPSSSALLAVKIAPSENVAKFLARLELLVHDAELEVAGIDFLPSSTAGRTTYSVEAVGTLEQVCDLIAGIETLSFVSLVESLDVRGRSDGRVDVTLGVARFHQ